MGAHRPRLLWVRSRPAKHVRFWRRSDAKRRDSVGGPATSKPSRKFGYSAYVAIEGIKSHSRERLSPPSRAPLGCPPARSIEGRDRSVSRRGSGAVAGECEMRGARRTPRPGGPSCTVPAPQVGVAGSPDGSAVMPVSAARCCRGPKRWVGPGCESGADLKTQPTGGRAEQA
jgi:hypothetical protein